MHKLIFYDIEGDKLRTKIAKILEGVGMVRLQKSVFVGFGNKVYWSKAQERLKNIMKDDLVGTDSLCILQIDESALKLAILFGNAKLMSTFEELKKEYLLL